MFESIRRGGHFFSWNESRWRKLLYIYTPIHLGNAKVRGAIELSGRIGEHQDADDGSGIECNVNVNDETKEASENNDRVEVQRAAPDILCVSRLGVRTSSSFFVSGKNNADIPWMARLEKRRNMVGRLHVLCSVEALVIVT
jgi:hypothetical protein